MSGILAEKQRLLPIALAQGVGLACGVLGVRVVSRLVEPAALGAYGVFLTFTTLGTWVVYSGLTKFVGRYWAAAEHEAMLRVVFGAWKRKLGWLSLAAAAAAVVMWKLTSLSIGAVFAAILIGAAGLSIAGLSQAGLQAARRNWHDLTTSAIGSVTRTFVPPLAYSLIGVAGLYAGFTVHAACFALVGMVCVLRTKQRSTMATPVALEPVYDGALFTTLAIVGWLLAGENRWLALWRFGDTTAGYFTLASNIALIVPTVVGAVLLQFLQPRFYLIGDRDTTEARTHLARNVDGMAFVFTVVAAVGVVLVRVVAPYLIGPLIAQKYASSIDWLIPVGCFGIATTTAGFYHMLLLAGRRERGCGPTDVSTAVILTTGAFVSAVIGSGAFKLWLTATAIIPWVVTRTFARFYLFKPAPSPVHAPAR